MLSENVRVTPRREHELAHAPTSRDLAAALVQSCINKPGDRRNVPLVFRSGCTNKPGDGRIVPLVLGTGA
jgi:hypothetical protein